MWQHSLNDLNAAIAKAHPGYHLGAGANGVALVADSAKAETKAAKAETK